ASKVRPFCRLAARIFSVASLRVIAGSSRLRNFCCGPNGRADRWWLVTAAVPAAGRSFLLRRSAAHGRRWGEEPPGGFSGRRPQGAAAVIRDPAVAAPPE